MGEVRNTQTVVEVARGAINGSIRNTQTVVEVVIPFVLAGPHYLKTGSAAVVFTATAVRFRPGIPAAAAASLTFTATASATRLYDKHASASVVLRAAADAIHGKIGRCAVRVIFTAFAPNLSNSRGVSCAVRVIFRARCRDRIPAIDFGDDYLGRFQVGQEVPLLVIVRDQHGVPADPTTVTPVARIYDLDAQREVEAVPLHKLRNSRFGQVYAHALRLSSKYAPARHGVLYQAPVGGFVGVFVAIFEVVPGGDPGGPVIATHALTRLDAERILAQLGSGTLTTGEGPDITSEG